MTPIFSLSWLMKIAVVRELPESLAHEPSLEPHVRISHLTLYLSSRNEGGHAVDHDDVQSARTDEGIGYLESLFSVIRLGEIEVFEVDTDGLGVGRVEGVLGVHEGGEAAGFLGFGDDMQGESGLAAGFGAEDLDDASPWDAADAGCQVEGQSAGGDRGDLPWGLVAHAHDGALSKLPLYLRDGGVYSFALIQCILQKRPSC
jgi:hypothetical protein